MEAGRIMLRRVDELLDRGETLALETTLAIRLYQQKIRTTQQQGYTVVALYFWLSSPQPAQERVQTRVLAGGHFIAPKVIDRWYRLGITCLFDRYLTLVDKAFLFDNSSGKPVLLAEKSVGSFFIIHNELYRQLLNQYESRKTA